ncbi:hypothetical protein GH714_017754 [Hevea brasiliensis]|uniref:Uncharacterized protein n=1 Tax=Hevea brasiliensis TaxID=3981 RepID=A0A6A6LHA5_HEVBR|nr:hypothetical protein GH714_017754 [Hevea brasiliensis]
MMEKRNRNRIFAACFVIPSKLVNACCGFCFVYLDAEEMGEIRWQKTDVGVVGLPVSPTEIYSVIYMTQSTLKTLSLYGMMINILNLYQDDSLLYSFAEDEEGEDDFTSSVYKEEVIRDLANIEKICLEDDNTGQNSEASSNSFERKK